MARPTLTPQTPGQAPAPAEPEAPIDDPRIAVVDGVELAASITIPAYVEIGLNSLALRDLVLSAFSRSGLSVEDWNELDEGFRDKLLTEEIALVNVEQEEPPADEPGVVLSAQVPQPDPVNELPDAKDIDPSKITRNTLSKQGWVLPTSNNVGG